MRMMSFAHRKVGVSAFAANVLAIALLAAPAMADELVLVDDGRSVAPIVLFEDAPPRTREAAEELASYIEKISGARPEIVEGQPDPVPERAIWVGYQPVMDSLFPEQSFEFEHPEEILIAANANHLTITGRDVWDPENMHVDGVPVQFEYGTANGVYTFLQDYLDVRWFWPGELGEDVIEQETIAFEPFEHRHHPQFRYRAGFLHTLMRHFRSGSSGDPQDWIRRQRLALGSLDMNAAGHGFGDWWERFHEEHPEYFALQPDGTRSGYPEPRNAKLCHSNPAVAEQWLKDVEAELEENPTARVFNASPNDSYHSGHCICDNCRAWDHPEAQKLNFTWQGLSQQYVALSDRHIKFANRCARLLKERYPEKDYYVAMLAYGNWRPAPVEAVPDDNVIITNVANMFWNLDQKTQTGRPADQFANWGKVADKQVWRPNTGSPVGWQQGFPDVPLHRTGNVIKHVGDHGGIGVSVDMVWEYWATQGPLYYLGTQLVWDHEREIDAILGDYYRRAFGPGAEDVEAYWTLMEQTRNTFMDEVGSWRVEKNYDRLSEFYTDELFDRAEALLEAAADQAEQADREIFARRVAFVRAGLDYTRLAMEGRALIDRYNQSEGTDEQAKELARQKWEQIVAIQEAHPDNFRWYRLAGNRNPMNADFLPTLSPRHRD